MMEKHQRGTILSVNISNQKGEKKQNIGRCVCIKNFGLENDAHGGPWIRQVSLLARESIDKIRNKGLDVQYGDFAENLTTEGIDLPVLPIGTTLKVGEGVFLRITKIGKECHTRCNIFKQVGDCVMPREGIFAEVLSDGTISVGDSIEVIS